MILSKVQLKGLTTIDLHILDASMADPYICKAIDGLGPPEVDVLMTRGFYQGRQPQDREVVARIGLNPDYSINQTPANLRSALYGLLSPGADDSFEMLLYDEFGAVFAKTKAYMKKLETVPFNKEPEVQLTFGCPTYYLEAPELQTVNPSHPDSAYFNIQNEGTAETGFDAGFVMRNNWPYFMLELYPGSLLDLDFPYMLIYHDFKINDRVYVNTNQGELDVFMVKAGGDFYNQRVNLLPGLTSTSTWLKLYSGLNKFRVMEADVHPGYGFRYTPKYWGI